MPAPHPGQWPQCAGGDPPRGRQRPQECWELHQDDSAQGQADTPRDVWPKCASGSAGRDWTAAVQPGGQTAHGGRRRGLVVPED